MMPETRAMCSVCARTVPASVEDDGKIVWIRKVCPEHGEQRAPIDTSKFYTFINQAFDETVLAARVGCTFLNVTDRCNLACANCYHVPGGKDYPADDVVALAKQVATPVIGVLGAEPTLRDDLPELLARLKEETGKCLAVFTNGLRYAEPGYAKSLVDAGMGLTAVGLNLPFYNGNVVFAKKIAGLMNLLALPGRVLDHVSFTGCVEEGLLDNARQTLTIIQALKLPPEVDIRVRPAAPVGRPGRLPVNLSLMVEAYYTAAKEQGLPFEVIPFNHHIYALAARIAGRFFVFVRWPTTDNIDLTDVKKSPSRGLMVPEYGELPSIHAGILFSRKREGKPMPSKELVV